MKLKEYQGKKLLKKYGIRVPQSQLVTSICSRPSWLAKAQVLTGNRARKGLIKPATEKNLKELFGRCREILLEEKIPVQAEYYLALTVDREKKEIVVLFSKQGGTGVEAAKQAQKISYSQFAAGQVSKVVDGIPEDFFWVIKAMYQLMKDYQALLVEINPLARSNQKLVALDAKIILDDNVSYDEFEKKQTKLEKQAEENNLKFVGLKGNIGVIGNGAGLVMATLDMIEHFGGKPACFLDLGGGASAVQMGKALEIVLKKEPQAILVNVFGGITRCDQVAQGLVDYLNQSKLDVFLVVRMVGTNQKKAKEILAKNEVSSFVSFEKAVKKAVENG